MPKFHTSVLTLAAGVLLAASMGAQAMPSTVYVSPSGSDASGAGTAASPFATVAKGLSSAQAGGIVMLEPGVYKTSVTITKAVTLESDAAKPGAVGNTVIDAAGQIHGIVVQGKGSSGTVIEGLTVRNAQKEGILVMNTARVTIEHNVVTANDQSCAGYRGCFNPNSSDEAPVGKFTFTNDVPCGNTDFKAHPGSDCEALHLMGVRDSKVIANTVDANLDGGIYLTDETGPTHGNLVEGNVVSQNLTDCGITLASHNPAAVGHPDKGGVFENTVTHNAAIDNGAAGVIMAGPIPGTAAYRNTVTANIVDGNGMPGIVIHAHAPGQNLNGNVITDNFLRANGGVIGDPDAGLTPQQTAGIVVFSANGPVTGTRVEGNQIADEHIGIWFSKTIRHPVNSGNRSVGAGVGTLLTVASAGK